MNQDILPKLPELCVEVLEEGEKPKSNWHPCYIGYNLEFKINALKSYCFARWDSKLYDLLLLAAAVEYCDKYRRRPKSGWGRKLCLRLPVHDFDAWNKREVRDSLLSCLNFLTGDVWEISFYKRKKVEPRPQQENLTFPYNAHSIIAYSEGMDSRCVGVISNQKLGEKLIRVRVGTKKDDKPKDKKEHFTAIPYKVKTYLQNNESSVRSRGFRFSTISAVAAFLVKAKEIIIPESGQGALGPALLRVGHVYGDYRNHPAFTCRMERFIKQFLNYDLKYVFPRLWNTKGETLAEANAIKPNNLWQETWSCWQGNRQVSFNGKKMQCGVCAACLLRRMSVHAANESENENSYIWDNLKAKSFESGAHLDFKNITQAQKEYAIGGVLHLDHLADLHAKPIYRSGLKLQADQIAYYLSSNPEETFANLQAMLEKHFNEWNDFLANLGEESFIQQWVRNRK